MLLDSIYGYFDTHIAFLKGSGSGSGRTFVKFIPNLKVQVQVQVWAEPQIRGSLVHYGFVYFYKMTLLDPITALGLM